MRAAVCHEFGRPLVIETVELVPASAGEVTVQVAACGVCHSDISYVDGEWGGALPSVYGHEVAGVVTAVGAGVTGMERGDHAVVTLVRSCGRCYFCLHEQPALCAGDFPIDHPGPLRLRDGTHVNQAMHVGGFAEAVTVDASQVVPVPRDIPLHSACLLACAVATGYGAVRNTAGVEPGSAVAVIGAGGVGLNAVQGAAIAGAEPVIAIDLSDSRLIAARDFGAHHALHGGAGAVARVRELTGGRGTDYTFLCVGAPAAALPAIEMTRRGGAVVVVGMPASGVTVPLDLGLVADSGLRLVGSKMGSIRPQADIPALVELYRGGRLKIDELVSATYPLDKINEALALSREGRGLRHVITFPT
jgi:Zn-dependent alcohol dehydrogenase